MGMWNRWVGLQSALKQQLDERISAIERRERTKPHFLEYERFHFAAKEEARRLEAALASLPRRPSTENTRGVKVRRRAIQSAPYLSFFSFHGGVEPYCMYSSTYHPKDPVDPSSGGPIHSFYKSMYILRVVFSYVLGVQYSKYMYAR